MKNSYCRISGLNCVVSFLVILFLVILGVSVFLLVSLLLMKRESSATRGPVVIRLVDEFKPENVEGTPQETVRTIDLMPTILELCGLHVPEAMQGQSFLLLFAATRRTSGESFATIEKNAASTAGQWWKEPAVCGYRHSEIEKRRNSERRNSYTIILDGWKLNVYESQEGEP